MSDVTQHRGLAVRLAYDITGSWADAEEIAQEAMVRALAASGLRDPRAFVARVTANLAIDRLRRVREAYVGPFLPEPVATGPGADDLLEQAEEVDSALLIALEALSPIERATLLLHDVFAFSFAEIGQMLERTPDAVRQAASRARKAVQARRPRFVPSPQQQRDLLERFAGAAQSGDVEALAALLIDDVALTSDGGGKVTAARRPVIGADRVARFLHGLAEQFAGRIGVVPLQLNHSLALAVLLDGEVDQVQWHQWEGDRISAVHIQRNPDKLALVRAALADR